MYASIADLRAEGVTLAQASNARLDALLVDACAFVDSVTGWFFDPRPRTYRLNGRGSSTLELPVPPIRIDSLSTEHESFSLDERELVVVGAPVGPGFGGPRITRTQGRRFPRGEGNVVVAGLWGYTEADGTPLGRTPAPIRLVTMQLVLRALPVLVDGDGWESARQRWRLIEERTRDQAYKLGARSLTTFLTGDPELDAVLLRFSRPMGLGAA